MCFTGRVYRTLRGKKPPDSRSQTPEGSPRMLPRGRMAMKTSRGASTLSFLLLVLGNGRAAGQARSSNDMAERVSKPVVYQVEGMDRVRVRKDLVYKKDGAVELKMDISTPEKQKPGESLPVV